MQWLGLLRESWHWWAIACLVFLCSGALGATGGCALPKYEVGDASTGANNGTGAGNGCDLGLGGVLASCEPTGGGGGPQMIPVRGGYCIDSTEITFGQYLDWAMAAQMAGFQQTAPCTWNDDPNPGESCLWNVQAQAENDPVVCVDWCDAQAYCQAHGKRLCGKIGGGASQLENYDSPTTDQWHNVCTSGGCFKYPYGNEYSSGTCRTGGAENYPAAVGSLPNCRTTAEGYGGVYDLSGNVWEWDDSCNHNLDKSDMCRRRGGSYYDGLGASECNAIGHASRNANGEKTGFRCCWEPT